MCGGDCRRIELGEGGGQSATAQRGVDIVGVGQQPEQLVVGTARGRQIGQSAFGRHQLTADPFPQFQAGDAAERNDQQLIQRRVPLGDVPGDESGDGVGLSGAGAGLQHGGADR